MAEPALSDKVVALHHALQKEGVAHAFGGALALAYYAEPRATVDIDLNVFVAPERHATVDRALQTVGIDSDVSNVEVEGQVRVRWGLTPIDLFYAYSPFHTAMERDVQIQPFGEAAIPILAAEHLLVCKALFNRPRDWLDIETVLDRNPHLRRREINTWMARLAGPDDPRAARLRAMV